MALRRNNYVVRVRRTDQFDDGAFTWEISRATHVGVELVAGRGFATEAEARAAGGEALTIFGRN